jgi:hypothetical protein
MSDFAFRHLLDLARALRLAQRGNLLSFKLFTMHNFPDYRQFGAGWAT